MTAWFAAILVGVPRNEEATVIGRIKAGVCLLRPATLALKGLTSAGVISVRETLLN